MRQQDWLRLTKALIAPVAVHGVCTHLHRLKLRQCTRQCSGGKAAAAVVQMPMSHSLVQGLCVCLCLIVSDCVCCAGREPGASPAVSQLGEERSTELSALVNNFILRRCVCVCGGEFVPDSD